MERKHIEPETSNVVGIQFGVMSPEEIRKDQLLK